MNFRHFKTREEARRFVEAQPQHPRLVIRRRGRPQKPFMVGTELSFLHFT